MASVATDKTAARIRSKVVFFIPPWWRRQRADCWACPFLQLFLKNHYPLLQKIVESGRMISVKIEQPANHMTEDARWDYRVTIRFKNSTVATTANPDEERLRSSADSSKGIRSLALV